MNYSVTNNRAPSNFSPKALSLLAANIFSEIHSLFSIYRGSNLTERKDDSKRSPAPLSPALGRPPSDCSTQRVLEDNEKFRPILLLVKNLRRLGQALGGFPSVVMKDNMTKEAQELLNTQPQAVWTVEQVALKLNIHPDAIPGLIKARILKPLGGPELRANCVKLFSSREIIELSDDPKRLNQMVAVIIKNTRLKNLRRLELRPGEEGQP